ncbi:MAG: MoaD/ThiS family protein [Ignavibacteriales bacterium]
MGISVTVRLDTLLAQIAGRKEVVVNLDGSAVPGEPVTITEALDEVARLLPDVSRILNDVTQRRYLKFTRNGTAVPEIEPLTQGDVVDIFSPFLGG